MGLLYNIVVLCGNGVIIYSIIVFYSVIWKWGWPQLRPQHTIQFLQSHSSPPISFFSSIIYIIIKDQQIYSTSLIFFGLSLLRSLDLWVLFLQGLAQPIAQAARRINKNFLVKCCLGYCLIFQVIMRVANFNNQDSSYLFGTFLVYIVVRKTYELS